MKNVKYTYYRKIHVCQNVSKLSEGYYNVIIKTIWCISASHALYKILVGANGGVGLPVAAVTKSVCRCVVPVSLSVNKIII